MASIVSARSQAEKDAEGFANAIVLSSDEDEAPPALPRPAPAPGASAPGSSAPGSSAPAGGAASRSSHDGEDVKPDVKRMKPDPGGAPQRSAPDGQPFPGTTELSADLSFGEPRPFKFGSETDSPRRAGHVIFKLSSPVPASGYDRHHGQSHVKLGTGYEISGLAKVQAALPWEVKVEDGTRGLELKDSVQRLCDPLNTCTPGRGKHRPCRPYRCVCPAPLLHVEWQPPLPWSLRRGQPPVCVRLDVWLQPDIFDMRISAWGSQRSCFFDVWQLMDRIVPSHRPIPRPRPPPVQGGAQALTPAGAATGGVQPAGPPGAYAFTLAGLMRALESAGYPEMEQPDGLKLTLFQFQRQSLQWMYDRETDVGGLNALFWEERPSDAGGVDRSGAPADHRFYYNPMAGELRSEPLPVVSGGFLCEEMGLGKTVEMCALVLANKYSRAAADAGRAVLTTGAALPPHSRATLVVCPVTLLAQWRREIAKCSGDTLKVLTFHGADRTQDAADFLDQQDGRAGPDVVLTTYEMLSLEARPGAPKTLRRVHWWRVVLDESQRLPRPAGVSGSSAFAAIARECAELSRTHSWLMSGTPAGSVVDDLLGQLVFLGVEPYCNRGADGDAFWEREISSRWRERSADALEVVHDLLGQIMMRHSKAQSFQGTGEIVTLPPKSEETVLVPLSDASERVVYGELERLCQQAIARGQQALRGGSQALGTRELQLVATHPATLNIEQLEGKLRQLAGDPQPDDALPPSRSGRGRGGRGRGRGGGAAASSPAPSSSSSSLPAGGSRLLRELLASSPDDSRALQMQAMLDDAALPVPSQLSRCGFCKAPLGGAGAADVLPAGDALFTRCCHLFCPRCVAGRGANNNCPECSAPNALLTADCLVLPLDSAPVVSAAASSSDPAPPPFEWDTPALPPASKLDGLRVWVCDGAVGGKCPDGGFSQRPTPHAIDGLHFCSMPCAERRFKAALVSRDHGGSAYVAKPGEAQLGWAGTQGLLAGKTFCRCPGMSANAAAVKALRKAREETPEEEAWEGLRLYGQGTTTKLVADPRVARLPDFPSDAPRHAFETHLDAAGGQRLYGMHWPLQLGSKLTAVMRELRALSAARAAKPASRKRAVSNRGGGGGTATKDSKAVIFSSSEAVLDVLSAQCRQEFGDGALSRIVGSSTHEERTEALDRFGTQAACFLLLLPVRACASGLTLTVADHCFLIELQGNGGQELQLINRVYRIGQSRPVTVKKFVAADTIEERMLELRKRSRGLLAAREQPAAAETAAEADAAAVSALPSGEEAGKGAHKSANAEAQTERFEDLRFLYGGARARG